MNHEERWLWSEVFQRGIDANRRIPDAAELANEAVAERRLAEKRIKERAKRKKRAS